VGSSTYLDLSLELILVQGMQKIKTQFELCFWCSKKHEMGTDFGVDFGACIAQNWR
jgi:hypothetical protein